jgi:predicted O-methyltransferase YrrM
MALALPDDGRLVAYDVSQKWTAIGRRHWQEADVAAKIDLRIGPATETMAELKNEGPPNRFDSIFIDADKTGYADYYERAFDLLRSGGLMVFDNMLHHGAIIDTDSASESVVAIRALNTRIAGDDRVSKVLVPIGDGMTLVRVV